MGTEISGQVSAFEIKGMKFGVTEGAKQSELIKLDTNKDGAISDCDEGLDDEAVAKLYLEKFKPGLGEHASFFVSHVSAYQDVKKAYASMTGADLGLDLSSSGVPGASISDMRFKVDCHDAKSAIGMLVLFYDPEAVVSPFGKGQLDFDGLEGWGHLYQNMPMWNMSPFTDEPDPNGFFAFFPHYSRPSMLFDEGSSGDVYLYRMMQRARTDGLGVGGYGLSSLRDDAYTLPIEKMEGHDLWPVVSDMVEDMRSKWQMIRSHPKTCAQHMLGFETLFPLVPSEMTFKVGVGKGPEAKEDLLKGR